MGETQTFLPEQVMAMLMTKLKVTAEAGLNTKIVDVVISVSTLIHFLHLHVHIQAGFSLAHIFVHFVTFLKQMSHICLDSASQWVQFAFSNRIGK